MVKVVFLDLDGTFVNSEEGIVKSVLYCVEPLGIKDVPIETLRKFIGPPLLDSLMENFGLSKEVATKALMRYRERYNTIGVLECEVYPEVFDMIERIKASGRTVAVCSAKPQVPLEMILKNVNAFDKLDGVYGADPNHIEEHKDSICKRALESMGITDPKEAVIIGDTKYDAMGASAVGMRCVGITYGFGTREELLENGAEAVFDTLTEAVEYIESL